MTKEKNLRISILGANSFLARNFIRYLQSENKNVEIDLYDIQNQHIDNEKRYKVIDFSDKISVKKINFDCDALFVFIGKTGTIKSFKEYESFILVNEIFLLNILNEYMNAGSSAKVIYPSTRLVYKGNEERAIKEEDTKQFNSVYAITKYAAEKHIDLYHRIYGLEYCILRICAPYGSLLKDEGNYGTYEFFVNQAKKDQTITLYGDGLIRKTYTQIEDICKLFFEVVENEKCIGIFNVGGENKSLLEIAKLVADKYNATIKFIKWPELDKKIEVGNVVLDSKKIENIINLELNKDNKKEKNSL